MARKPKRDLTVQEQLARGPVDLPFLMLVLLLLGIGLIMMFSASYATAYYNDGDPLVYITRQALFGGVGVVAMYLVSKINYQTFRALSMVGIVGSIGMLILVYTPLGVVHNGARRWLNLGVEFQPSELAKIAIIVFFAARLSKRDTQKHKRYKNRTFWGRLYNFLDAIGFIELVPYAAVLLIVAGLVVKQPHMSGTMLILVGGAAVLFAAGISLGWFAAGGAVVGIGMWAIITLTPYMTARINLWQDPWAQRQGDGYQTVQSLIAMGSGGLLGRGLGNSMQKMLYIPEPENDFVFPIVVEELGFVGGLVVLVLFALLILRGYWLALNARDKFGALTIVGIITLLAFQVFLNIGVVTNLIPNTGISLPFFSYGGTALLIQLAEMGMVLSVSRQCRAAKND